MTDIVERLRFLASGQDDAHSVAIAEAADEIERLRLDAARYRWLRMKTAGFRDNEGRPYFSFPSKFGLPPVTDIMRGSVGQHLDAAIDAAMKG